MASGANHTSPLVLVDAKFLSFYFQLGQSIQVSHSGNCGLPSQFQQWGVQIHFLLVPAGDRLDVVEVYIMGADFNPYSFKASSVSPSSPSYCGKVDDSVGGPYCKVFDIKCAAPKKGLWTVLIHRSSAVFNLCEVEAYGCCTPDAL